MKWSFLTSHKPTLILYYERYMLVMGIVGQLLFYLQAIKIFMIKSAHDVSIAGFLLGFASVSSWTIYGFVIKNKVILISNLFALIGATLTLVGILLYS